MWVLIIFLIAIGVLAYIAGLIRKHRLEKRVEAGEIEEFPDIIEIDSGCCGQHEICEKDSLLAAVSKRIEYYDDEELDAYIGLPPSDYNNTQVEQFRDILYTMQETDVAGWVRSLMLRGINLPNEIKDEVFLIIGERRIHA